MTETTDCPLGPAPARRRCPFSRLLTVALVLTTLAGCRTAIDPVAIADARVAADIKTALVNDPAVGRLTIEVRVVGAVATLSGTVETQVEADRAATIARGVQGVRAVRLELRIGGASTSAPDAAPASAPSAPQGSVGDRESDPGLFALGATLGWSYPRDAALGHRASVGPLFRLGNGRGFGPTLALGWFQTSLTGNSPDVISRLHIKPIMVGAGYTFASDRVSVSPSLVGGIAFNSVTVDSSGAANGVAVEVANSLVWRPGVSVWLDLSRRTALNLSVGYVMTGLRVTFLENGDLVTRDVRGDTTVVHAGLAYKLF